MRYEIAEGPTLVADGDSVGLVIRWHKDGDGLAVYAGRPDRKFILTKENSELERVVFVLNGFISMP